MPKVKPSANDKFVDGHQKDASKVETADDKASNGKTSGGNRKVATVKKMTVDGKTVDVGQKDASEVETADDKASNDKTSGGNRKVSKVKIVSADGKSFFVDEKVFTKFKFADEKAEDAIVEESQSMEKIDSDILTTMIKWAEHHVDDPETDYDYEDDKVQRTDDIDEWDEKLLDLDVETLFRLANASKITQMASLSQVLLQKLASMIKGKTPDEMRKVFNIPEINKEKKIKKGGQES